MAGGFVIFRPKLVSLPPIVNVEPYRSNRTNFLFPSLRVEWASLPVHDRLTVKSVLRHLILTGLASTTSYQYSHGERFFTKCATPNKFLFVPMFPLTQHTTRERWGLWARYIFCDRRVDTDSRIYVSSAEPLQEVLNELWGVGGFTMKEETYGFTTLICERIPLQQLPLVPPPLTL